MSQTGEYPSDVYLLVDRMTVPAMENGMPEESFSQTDWEDLQTRLHSQLTSQSSPLSTVPLKLKCASESIERLAKTLTARFHRVSDSAGAKNVHF